MNNADMMNALDQQLLDCVMRAIEPESAEQQIEQRLDYIIRELDEFCKMATNPETIDLIEREKTAIGQIVVRAQLAAALLMAKQPGKLRLVHA